MKERAPRFRSDLPHLQERRFKAEGGPRCDALFRPPPPGAPGPRGAQLCAVGAGGAGGAGRAGGVGVAAGGGASRWLRGIAGHATPSSGEPRGGHAGPAWSSCPTALASRCGAQATVNMNLVAGAFLRMLVLLSVQPRSTGVAGNTCEYSASFQTYTDNTALCFCF